MINVEYELNGRVIGSCTMSHVPLPRIGETVCINCQGYKLFRVIDVVHLIENGDKLPSITIVLERKVGFVVE